MSTNALIAKIRANAQKRNFLQFIKKFYDSEFPVSITREIYFPDSNFIIDEIQNGMASGAWKSESFLEDGNLLEIQSINILHKFSSSSENLFCFFKFRPRFFNGDACDFPVLEIHPNSSVEFYRIGSELSFDFCFFSSTDFKFGMAIDVYEADPIIHKSSGAVSDLYIWGFPSTVDTSMLDAR